MHEPGCPTSPCHDNRPLTLNMPSLHFNISENLVICCSVSSMLNWQSCENTESTEDILFKKFVPLDAMVRFLNLTGYRLFSFIDKKLC